MIVPNNTPACVYIITKKSGASERILKAWQSTCERAIQSKKPNINTFNSPPTSVPIHHHHPEYVPVASSDDPTFRTIALIYSLDVAPSSSPFQHPTPRDILIRSLKPPFHHKTTHQSFAMSLNLEKQLCFVSPLSRTSSPSSTKRS